MTVYKVNRGFLAFYAIIMSVNAINVAFTTGGNNQTANIFAAKLMWTPEEVRRNNTFINLASQIGKAIGATYGGKIIPLGRKRAFIIFNVLAILSMGLQ